MSRDAPRPWRTVERSLALDRSPWLRVFDEAVERPEDGARFAFTTLEQPDFAIALATLADAPDHALALRHYKHGPRRVTLDLPAGHLAEGESAERAARRELLEETGHEAPVWRALGAFVADGNRGSATAHLFLATGARHVGAPASDDLETTEVLRLPLDELRLLARRGEVGTLAAAACIGLGLDAWASDVRRPSSSDG